MLIVGHDKFGLCRNRAVDKLVVVRIGGDNVKLEG
jgi:hypothetical protein